MVRLLFIGNQIAVTVALLVILAVIIEILRFLLTPKIAISPKIARETVTAPNSKEKKKVFCIKVVNKSWFFKMTDLNAALYIEQPARASDGCIRKTRLKLLRDKILYLNKYQKTDKKASYTLHFICLDDIDNLWTDGTEASLTFKVILRHGFSGKTRIISKKYYYPTAALFDGTFKQGKSLDISYN